MPSQDSLDRCLRREPDLQRGILFIEVRCSDAQQPDHGPDEEMTIRALSHPLHKLTRRFATHVLFPFSNPGWKKKGRKPRLSPEGIGSAKDRRSLAAILYLDWLAFQSPGHSLQACASPTHGGG